MVMRQKYYNLYKKNSTKSIIVIYVKPSNFSVLIKYNREREINREGESSLYLYMCPLHRQIA